MKRRIVMACCGVFVATLVMSAEHAADPAAVEPRTRLRVGATTDGLRR